MYVAYNMCDSVSLIHFFTHIQQGDKNVSGDSTKVACYAIGKHEWGPSNKMYLELRRRRKVYPVNEGQTSLKCPDDDRCRIVGYLDYEKGHRIPEEVKREIYVFNPKGSRMTRSGVDSAPVPKLVHGTLCCVRCGALKRDGGVSAVSMGLHIGARQMKGKFRPEFLRRNENPVRFDTTLLEAKQLVRDQH